jgi:hypothetical protein
VGVKKWAAEYNDRIVDEKLLDENIQGAESINYLLNKVIKNRIQDISVDRHYLCY